jgi:hypothetical protein
MPGHGSLPCARVRVSLCVRASMDAGGQCYHRLTAMCHGVHAAAESFIWSIDGSRIHYSKRRNVRRPKPSDIRNKPSEIDYFRR